MRRGVEPLKTPGPDSEEMARTADAPQVQYCSLPGVTPTSEKETLGRAYAWGTAHPEVWIKDVQKETGIDAQTAKIQVDNGKQLVKHVSPEILRNEQKLADTFYDAHQITKQVDVAKIVDNLLPRDFTGREGDR